METKRIATEESGARQTSGQAPDSRFVSFGPVYIAAAERKRIVERIEVRYAERLSRAAWWNRWWIQIRMEWEIVRALRRRLRRAAPEDGLYWLPQHVWTPLARRP